MRKSIALNFIILLFLVPCSSKVVTLADSKETCSSEVLKMSEDETIVFGFKDGVEWCNHLIIPEGVVSIIDHAFSGELLVSVSFPSTLALVGTGTFYGAGLYNVYFSRTSNPITVGNKAFAVNQLVNVDIFNGAIVHENAFEDNKNIKITKISNRNVSQLYAEETIKAKKINNRNKSRKKDTGEYSYVSDDQSSLL